MDIPEAFYNPRGYPAFELPSVVVAEGLPIGFPFFLLGWFPFLENILFGVFLKQRKASVLWEVAFGWHHKTAFRKSEPLAISSFDFSDRFPFTRNPDAGLSSPKCISVIAILGILEPVCEIIFEIRESEKRKLSIKRGKQRISREFTPLSNRHWAIIADDASNSLI